MPLAEAVIRRLTLSRYLLQLATQNARSNLDVAAAACINMLQDAIEIFLLAAIDHLNVHVGARTDFPQYLDKINEATGDELPFRRRLLEINKVRVLSKHDGIPPNQKEIEGYVSDAWEFLEQASKKILSVDFWSISLITLLEDKESKNLILEAEQEFKNGEYENCLISCRKAFFVEFETFYDTQKDLKAEFSLFGSRAPYYARNKEYIEKHVATPFDYIVLDHGEIDADLTKEGIGHTAFWNVWRLTPQVYRHDDKDEWISKHEPQKFEKEGIVERAAHTLEAMVTILLARQSNRKMMKWITDRLNYVADLRKEETTVYKKADRTSAIAGTTRLGLKTIHVEYSTPGLKQDGTYWYMMDFDKSYFLSGFIPEEDLDLKQNQRGLM